MATNYRSAATAKIFSKVNKVTISKMNNSSETALGEVPVIEDTVTVNTGDLEKSEIKLINGTTWTSKVTRGDSDVSFQIPALDDEILSYFFEKDASTGKYKMTTSQQNADVIFEDADGDKITFDGCELYGSLVLGDSENPGYINVTVTPKDTFSWTNHS